MIPVSTPMKSSSMFVNSLAKGLKVLECFGQGRSDLGITDIARLTGFEKSGAHRLINTLYELGFLEKDVQSRRYRMTSKALVFAFNYLSDNPILEIATPYLINLSEELQRSVAMCVLDNQDIVYIARIKRGEFYHPHAHLGEKQPAYCTSSGRAILAFLPDSESRKIIMTSDRRKLTPSTKTNPDEIIDQLNKTREQGYCIQVGEFITGEINFAAPVFDEMGRPIASILVNQLWGKKDYHELEEQIIPQLLHVARYVSKSISNRA